MNPRQGTVLELPTFFAKSCRLIQRGTHDTEVNIQVSTDNLVDF